MQLRRQSVALSGTHLNRRRSPRAPLRQRSQRREDVPRVRGRCRGRLGRRRGRVVRPWLGIHGDGARYGAEPSEERTRREGAQIPGWLRGRNRAR